MGYRTDVRLVERLAALEGKRWHAGVVSEVDTQA
jgi:hypothetical protein